MKLLWALTHSNILLLATFSFYILSAEAMPPQQCQTSTESCEFYECVREEYSCGPRGYVENFGQKNCQRYLDVEPEANEELKRFYPLARVCLQNEMKEDFAEFSLEMTCKILKKQAYKAHIKCFVESGYCELSPVNRKAVLKVAGLTILAPSSIKTGLQILRRCKELKNP